MPLSYQREHRRPANPVHRLIDAAYVGQLMIVHAPPFPCSKCGRTDYIKVSLKIPETGDYGHLIVRRPAGVKRVQKWQNVMLGD